MDVSVALTKKMCFGCVPVGEFVWWYAHTLTGTSAKVPIISIRITCAITYILLGSCESLEERMCDAGGEEYLGWLRATPDKDAQYRAKCTYLS